MSYPTPEPGDLCVCKIDGAGGAGIDFAEWFNGAKAFSHWDHVRIALGSGMVLQAEPHGAQIVPHDPQPGELWSTGLPSLALDATQQSQVWELGHQLEHTPYSALDYWALAAHRMKLPDWPIWPGKDHKVTLQEYIADSHHFMCSALADYVRLRLGSHLFDDGRWFGYVTPYDLGVLISKAGGKPLS
jgi:hypothetical protein